MSIVFPAEFPETRYDLFRVISSQPTEWKAKAIVDFCNIVKDITNEEIYDKAVKHADQKYGQFSFWDINVEKELRQECIDLLVYIAIRDMMVHYFNPDAAQEES